MDQTHCGIKYCKGVHCIQETGELVEIPMGVGGGVKLKTCFFAFSENNKTRVDTLRAAVRWGVIGRKDL